MSAELFTDAMSQISDKYITEALNYHSAAKRRPAIYRFSRSVAVACLTVVLCFGTVMAVSAEARAAVFGWVRQQCGVFYEYFFEGKATTAPAKYELGWVPEGVEFVTSYETAGGEVFIYTDDKDTLIQFSYIADPDNGKLYMDSVGDEQIPVTVNDNEGVVYFSPSEEKTNDIIWTNSDNVLFAISGHFDEDTLIKMAESVQEKK